MTASELLSYLIIGYVAGTVIGLSLQKEHKISIGALIANFTFFTIFGYTACKILVAFL